MALSWGVRAVLPALFALPAPGVPGVESFAVVRARYGLAFAVGVWAWAQFTRAPLEALVEVEAIVELGFLMQDALEADLDWRTPPRIAPRTRMPRTPHLPVDDARDYMLAQPVRRADLVAFSLADAASFEGSGFGTYAHELAHWWDRVVAAGALPPDLTPHPRKQR